MSERSSNYVPGATKVGATIPLVAVGECGTGVVEATVVALNEIDGHVTPGKVVIAAVAVVLWLSDAKGAKTGADVASDEVTWVIVLAVVDGTVNRLEVTSYSVVVEAGSSVNDGTTTGATVATAVGTYAEW